MRRPSWLRRCWSADASRVNAVGDDTALARSRRSQRPRRASRQRAAGKREEILEVFLALAEELPADAADRRAVLRRIERNPSPFCVRPLGARIRVRVAAPAGHRVVGEAADSILPAAKKAIQTRYPGGRS